jgi:isoleucyl-tRNA synthetase
MSFPEIEEDILNYWRDNNIFEKSLQESKDKPKFTFYDGPPFATGLPHYGHIVASTIKDIIPRYKTQTGYHVPRVFGWDTHGLPIEFEIEKSLGIKTKQDVLKLGIGNYNEECRKIVMRYSGEWKKTIERLGRWVDFENGYKTMDTSFMESVWWVFKQLYEKELIYHGVKVMPYSTACNTPLSNFEAKSNYKSVSDPSVTIKFQLANRSIPTYFLVWTTTPWTLPSNLLLCVNPDMEYVEISMDDENYIIAKNEAEKYTKLKGNIVNTYKGIDLVDIEYIPLFPYFKEDYQNAFRVVADDYVSAGSGTGIVHIAPAFGEDDYRVAKKEEVITKTKLPPCPLDDNGIFTEKVLDFTNLKVKDADKPILSKLKKENKVFEVKYEKHEYPFCWRSNTPLIYRSVPCWFMNVESVKEKIVANNAKTSWIPSNLRDGRFGTWLKESRDWCISRNRFWGTPIPLWVNDDYSEVVCVGSISELEYLACLAPGSLTDLHRHRIDDIKIPSKTNLGTFLHRIEEVFDCWFESGAMPYASVHYPFKNEEMFENEMFPADFIGEGLDQTRGWFYTLMVLSSALFDKPAFKNVIVNGLVLASDGEKMSKSKKNYPDPHIILDKYGSDALRLYLISTSIVRAEPMKFNEKSINEIKRNVQVFLNNVLKFIEQMVPYYEKNHSTKFELISFDKLKKMKLNIFDEMILSYMQEFIDNIHEDMGKYQLYNIVNRIQEYIDKISRWYINMNKNRFKSDVASEREDVQICLSVLVHNLRTYAIMSAPFAPFMAEHIYQNLSKYMDSNLESVHLEQMPDSLYEYDKNMVLAINAVENIIEATRQIRNEKNFTSKKMPIAYMKVIVKYSGLKPIIKSAKEQLMQVCNIIDMDIQDDYKDYIVNRVKINTKTIGPKYKKDAKTIVNKIESCDQSTLELMMTTLKKNGEVDFFGYILNKEDVYLENLPKTIYNKDETEILLLKDPVVIYAETTLNSQIMQVYEVKRFIRFIQGLRKEKGLVPTDDIKVFMNAFEKEQFISFIEVNREEIEKSLRSKIYYQTLENVDTNYEFNDDIIPLNIMQI